MKSIISFDAGDTLFRGSVFIQISQLSNSSLNNVKSAFKHHYNKTSSSWRGVDIFATSSVLSSYWADIYREIFKDLGDNNRRANLNYSKLMKIREHGDWYKLRTGVAATLTELRESGFRLIVSSNWSSDLIDILKKLHIDTLIDDVYTSAKLGISKPRNDFYDKISLNEKSKDIVHFGDSEQDDVVAANAYGWKGVLISPKDNFKKIVCNYILKEGII